MVQVFSVRKWLDRVLGTPIFSHKLLTRKVFRLGLEELERRLAPATTLSIADASTIEPANARKLLRNDNIMAVLLMPPPARVKQPARTAASTRSGRTATFIRWGRSSTNC